MANTKEIQKRMKSIRDTMKITSAMYMISSAKLRSAKQKLDQTEPYFYALQGSISRCLRHIPEVQNRYFDQKKEIPEEEKRRGYIAVSYTHLDVYKRQVCTLSQERSVRQLRADFPDGHLAGSVMMSWQQARRRKLQMESTICPPSSRQSSMHYADWHYYLYIRFPRRR